MIILDSNILIHWANNLVLPPRANTEIVAMSIISEIEIWSWAEMPPAHAKSLLEVSKLVDTIPLTEPIKHETIRLRREYRLRIPDAIVAATAICYEAQLWSCDTDFQRVPDLSIHAPPLRRD